MNNELRENLLRYIKNEKDISQYKIAALSRKKNLNLSQRRLLDIETEFISLPFENMEFEDVADVAAAIAIYRISRISFYKTYIAKEKIDTQNLGKSLISDKTDFLKNLSQELMISRVEEVNLVQNSELYFDLIKKQSIKNNTSVDFEKRNLDEMNLDSLLQIEPAIISRKRARIQATLFSMGKFIDDKLSEPNLNDESLDLIIDDLEDNIFKNYNLALQELPNRIQNSMGRNGYISKVHELSNILNSDYGDVCYPINSHVEYSDSTSKLGNIYFGVKRIINTTIVKDCEKKVQNKVYGILLRIPRMGNEKMTILYKNIVINDVNITKLFNKELSNVKAKNSEDREEYFKAVLMEPFWRLIEEAKSDHGVAKIISMLTKVDIHELLSMDFNDQEIINKFNQKHSGFLSINYNSEVLVPRTRSEEDAFDELVLMAKAKVNEIKMDYDKLFAINNVI